MFSMCGKPLKLVAQSTYHSNNLSTSENVVNMLLAKVWTAI